MKVYNGFKTPYMHTKKFKPNGIISINYSKSPVYKEYNKSKEFRLEYIQTTSHDSTLYIIQSSETTHVRLSKDLYLRERDDGV